MTRLKSLIPTLAGALLFLTGLTSAISAKPIMPRKTMAFQQATATAGPTASIASSFNSTASLSASSGFASSNSSSNRPTPTPKVLMTQTDGAGRVVVCTSLDTLTWGSPVVSTESYCAGSLIPLSTDTGIRQSWDAHVSSLAPASAPTSGCSIATDKQDGSNTAYCTCAGSGTLSASRVSTILGLYSANLTTACNTGAGSLPTEYVEVPAISDENGEQLWAQTPSFGSNGVCFDGNDLDSECWQLLDMDEYVKWWWGAFNHTCDGTQVFSDCFFQSVNISPSDCSVLSLKSACSQPTWANFKNMWNGLRNFYWTIHSINAFFAAYSQALVDAQASAEAMIGSIVSVVDPPKKKNVAMNDILTALSTGLAFFPGPEAAIGKAILKGAQQSIPVSKSIFPQSTENSQLIEMQEISANLVWAVGALQSNLTLALQTLMTDSDSFVAFATSGAFSVANMTDDHTLSGMILNGLNAYVISQAYQTTDSDHHGVFITRQLNTSVYALQSNSTPLSYNLSCTTNYDSNGICDTFWYDPIDDTTYALTSRDSRNRKQNYNQDMNTWFPKYTQPEILFRGAAYCAAASQSTQGTGPQLSISSTDFNTNCLSNMRVCTWNLEPGGNWDPLFSDCTDEEAFGAIGDGVGSNDRSGQPCEGIHSTLGVIDGGEEVYSRTWRQYLGWGVHKDVAAQEKVEFCQY